jgi:hypothetical protein
MRRQSVKRIIALGLAGLIFACAVPAWAKPKKKEKSQTWEEMNLQVNAFRRRGQYPQAIELGERAVEAAATAYGAESSNVAIESKRKRAAPTAFSSPRCWPTSPT